MEQQWDYFSRNSAINAEDVQKRLHDAHSAAKGGRYEEALDGYIWFHENSENVPGLGGVRLSFALAYWVDLGRVYPPARTALEEIRDRKTKSILRGFRDVASFHDVVAINKHLGCERATYELFVALNSSSPALASNYSSLALPAIINSGDLHLARQFLPCPREELQRLAETFKMMSARIDLQTCIRLYVDDVNIILETLRGVEDLEQADHVYASALESFESVQVREAVRLALDGPK
jgi:hypothetical protein